MTYTRRISNSIFNIIVFGSLVAGFNMQTFAQSRTWATKAPSQQVGDADQLLKVDQMRLAEAYGKLPLTFEVNQGQTDSRVKFLSRGSRYTLFLTPSEAVLELATGHSQPSRRPGVSGADRALGKGEAQQSAVLRVRLTGANPSPVVGGLEELPGKSNYFIGKDPKKWRTNVPTFGKVRYRDVYPGIDLVYYGNQRQLEHDFIVAPGSDPRAIRLKVEGAKKIRLDGGNLVLEVPGGEVRLRKPLVYQELAGERREIAGGYTLERPNRVGFRVASYDTNRPLIIDPVLMYSTYLGGSGLDETRGIAVDASGSAYVTGFTDSPNFPTTSGTFQTTFAGSGGFPFLCCDAFVAKLNPTGSGLVYSTYLGGSGPDSGFGIAVDSSGNAYVTGDTESTTDFPTTSGVFQTAFGGSGFWAGATFGDGFVAKLNPTGSGLVYSTYLGGNGADEAHGIAIDPSGNAYIVGLTRSTNFPSSAALQSTLTGFVSGFVTKLNASGSGLVYSTYFNGNSSTTTGIAADASGNAYVAGSSECSGSLPITSGAYQTTCAGGSDDNFVVKLNPTGGLLYSTYLGGSGSDEPGGIAVDSSGNAYVTGRTDSPNFPMTTGAFQTGSGGSTDTFVSKLNSSGTQLLYSTYLGGSGGDYGQAIALNTSGEAYVAGQTASTDFPTTNAVQPVSGGPSDGFLTKLNAAGSAVLYSTYLGGSGSNDAALGVAVDASGSGYVAGLTNSTDFPMTSGALQASSGGGQYDGFVAKIASSSPTSATVTSSANPSMFGQSVTFTAMVTGSGGTPTGMVTFNDGTTAIGTGTMSGGQATFNSSSLSVGSHSITVVYGGDSNFSGSTSAVLAQIVNKASTSTAVSSSANPSILNQSVTFTATVTVVAPGAGTPTGTVTFMDGSATLGSGTLNSAGQVTLTTSPLAVNSHSITAVYAGDSNFTGSTSAALSQLVHYEPLGTNCYGDLGHQILQPINADGSSVWKQGRTIPAKFRVCDINGVSVGTTGVVSGFFLTQIISGTVTNVDETVDSTSSDTVFRWDAANQQWIFNISTKSLAANKTYVYTITLNDGTTIVFQYGLK
ncbi:MAG: SBBP repeat-containing protein [Terriglobales bacterium]